ncbi:ATP-binding cassette domain-containing protein [Acrocarpospora sp. B8E8]|uniref:ABC transporter ATP-binding protein n=1 Tax=Acrocarpospora sp. B8E8 TaxID=3153572 RepID=UPI00325CDE1F
MLAASDIRVRFGGVVAVDQVSLIVHDHEIVGLIGPNGSGKSTLINALTGLVPAEGSLEVDGKPVPLGRPGAVSRLGVLRTFQTPQVHDALTCLENALIGLQEWNLRTLAAAWLRRRAMMRAERGRWERAQEALEFAGLADKSDALAGALSYGERRRLELARVYLGRPRTLLLDEPAAGLNQVETQTLVRLLKSWRDADGPALLLVEHKIDFLEELCHRMIVLELGKQIAAGEPAEVWADPRVMDAYLGSVVIDA